MPIAAGPDVMVPAVTDPVGNPDCARVGRSGPVAGLPIPMTISPHPAALDPDEAHPRRGYDRLRQWWRGRFVHLHLASNGLSDRGIYFVIIMSSAPAVAIATSDGVLHIPRIYLQVARTLGTPAYAMPVRIILPASLPSIVTGMKLGWTLAWHGGVSAELIKSTIGLGFLLQMGRELNDAAQVIGIMVLTVIFGVLLDQFVFGLIQKRILVRWGLAQKA